MRTEHEQHVFTTAQPPLIPELTKCTTTASLCTATESIRHTQHGLTITFLKQLREERREQREEERKEAAKRTAHEVQSANANPTTDTITVNAPTSYTACDLLMFSSGTQNPWGSLQWRNCCSHPWGPWNSTHHAYNSFRYPTDNYMCIPTPPQPPTCPIETIWHPYRIRPAKPVIRVLVHCYINHNYIQNFRPELRLNLYIYGLYLCLQTYNMPTYCMLTSHIVHYQLQTFTDPDPVINYPTSTLCSQLCRSYIN